MQLITAPIPHGVKGDLVKNLHYCLFLVKRSANDSTINSLYVDPSFKPEYVAEINTSLYGPKTVQLISTIQRLNSIKPEMLPGDVDLPTMVVINKSVTQFDFANITVPDGFNDYINDNGSSNTSFKVNGHVVNSRNEMIPGQLVLAFDIDLKGSRLYRTAKTFSEFASNGGVQYLNSDISDSNGFYEIDFNLSSFQQNELSPTDTADVVVLAFQSPLGSNQEFPDDNNPIVGRSALSIRSDYTKNELTDWDVLIETDSIRGETEYSRLTRIVIPFVTANQMDIKDAKGWPDQLKFLAAETGQDLFNVTQLVDAFALYFDAIFGGQGNVSTDVNIAVELLYGIGRQSITLSWVALLMKTENELIAAIKKSSDENIISAQNEKLTLVFVRNLRLFASQHSANAPETSHFYKIIGFTLKDSALQGNFAQSLLQFRGSPENFWNNLSQQQGFTPDVIQALQLTNQLSLLTGQHVALIQELQVNQGIKDPSDLLLLKPEAWTALIQKVGVPDPIPGNTPEEKAANYIADMQTTLNAAYATKKITLMIADNQLQLNDSGVKEKLSAFLSAAQNFDVSSSRINDPQFDGVLKRVAGDLYEKTRQQLKLIQRIYQVSSTPEVMNALIARGYTSSYHISSVSQNTFINKEAANLGGADVAFSVYNRARHQVMRAQHTLLKVRDGQDNATPSKIVTGDQQQAINKFLNSLNA